MHVTFIAARALIGMSAFPLPEGLAALSQTPDQGAPRCRTRRHLTDARQHADCLGLAQLVHATPSAALFSARDPNH